MVLYLIRHAQSANNLSFAKTNSNRDRVEDPELTELGRKQAEALAAYVSRELTFTHLYTSLMVRAVATADAIGGRMQISPVAWPELHECMGIFLRNEDTGALEGQAGKNRAFFESLFPALVLPDSLNEHGWWNRPAETRDQWVQRARSFVTELKTRHSGAKDCVAIVTHGDFYREILCALFALPSDSDLWFRLDNTGISGIDFEDDRIKVSYLNRIDHLPLDLRTIEARKTGAVRGPTEPD